MGQEGGPPAPPEDSTPPVAEDSPREVAPADDPGGLLGLLLWPLRTAISLAMKLFAAFVAGVFGALLPGSRKEPPDDES